MVAQGCEFRVCALPGRNSARGFTLVEIVIVLVILSIVALAAIPLVSSGGSMQIRSAANLIAADLEFAKSTAIGRGESFTVVFDDTTESYTIKDAKGEKIAHPVKKGFDYIMNLGEEGLDKVDIFGVDFDGTSEIKFDYLGSPYNGDNNPLSSGTISLKAGSATMTIIVEPVTGFISIVN